VQRARQQDGRGGVGAPVAVHGRVAEAGHLVVLEQRGVVDHRVQPAGLRQRRRQQADAGCLVAQVGLQQPDRAPSARASAAVASASACRAAVMQPQVPAVPRQLEHDRRGRCDARRR
jgi:hypothetical protein